MTSPANIYAKGIKTKFVNYWAAWLPNTRYNLGDIGVLNGYLFEKKCNLKDLEIDFATEKREESSPLDYVSESGVNIDIKMSGQTSRAIPSIPEAKAGIGISFSSKGAFIIQAENTYESIISNPLELEQKIITAYKDGKWNSAYVVIIKIIEAPSATIIISNSSSSKIELIAGSDIDDGLLELGKADCEFNLSKQNGDILRIIGAENITPIFQIGNIKKRIFNPYSFSTKSIAPDKRKFDDTNLYHSRFKTEILDSLYFDLCLDSES
jgi:hypothetical protein